MTAKRSVFSASELAGRQKASEKPMKVIDFLLAGHSTPPVRLGTLLDKGIFNGSPPQSIARLDETRYLRLRPLLNLGFRNSKLACGHRWRRNPSIARRARRRPLSCP